MYHTKADPQASGFLSLVQIKKLLNISLGELIELVRQETDDYFPCVVDGDKTLYSPLAVKRMRNLLSPGDHSGKDSADPNLARFSATGNIIDLVDRLLARQQQINTRFERAYGQIQNPRVQAQTKQNDANKDATAGKS